jgi:hypothetical protein
MSGLIFLAIVGLWVWLAFKLSRFISGRLVQGRWAKPLTALLFLVLLPLPIIDEIIGGFQFRALCDRDAKLVFNVDPASLKGKTVRSVADPLNRSVEGSFVRIHQSNYRYYDADDGRELLRYTEFYAKGGLLTRALSGQSDITPLTFGFSTCTPLPQTDLGFKFAKKEN